MKNKNPGTWLFMALMALCLSACVNLKSVTDYSTAASAGIKNYEEIDYTFSQHCYERCQFEAIRNFEVKKESDCDCETYQKADSVTLLIYNAIKGYFDGLINLSANELTDYSFDALQTSLTEGNFGKIKIEKEHVEAYGTISKILLKATTDLYRKKKLKVYIEEANEPLQLLLNKFQFIIQNNLEGELSFKKEKLYVYYKEMSLSTTLTDYEKGKGIIDYYRQLSEIDAKQKQIDAYAKSIKIIAEGHQKLFDNRNKMTIKELQELLSSYTSNIKDIISEFKKLKK
ncbi:MAG TPA: hypothetical protein PLT47_11635 [Bacteroidales bacterium]|nr:hypothetical protein [Bacteroidales bacterium]HQI71396.1 hypothetical protein [Bacteroidales bacterium]